MFEQLTTDAASRFNASTGSISAIVRGLLSLMTNERTGGVEGFVELFRRVGLGDVITSWFGGKEGSTLSPSQLESALGPNEVDRLATSSGLTRSLVSSAAAFLLPRMLGRLTPAGLLPSTAALRSQVSSYLAGPVVSPVERLETTHDRAGVPRWLPWAVTAAALLALGAWLVTRGPAGTIDPQLTLSNRDGRITYSGVVHDEAARSQVVGALGRTFGEGNINGDIRVDRNVRRAAWLPHFGDLAAAAKTPGADFTLNGNTIRLGGWLSAADRGAISDRLRGVFGSAVTIEAAGDPAVEATRAANDKAMSALRAIGTSGVSPDALVHAMNLSVINFSTGSADIPPDSQEVIRTSAEAIKRAPAGSVVEVGGHTDNTGNAASNMALSQARADAVKRALVAAGVPAESLMAKGYGDTRPRAPNDTEYGRFQNRRIEYSVVR